MVLIRDFVNTAEPQVAGDEWTTPEAAQDWLSARRLLVGADPDAPLGPDDLRRLRALREGLREILHGHADDDVDPAAVDTVNLELAVRNRTWERLKACSRDTCRWAFYDGSRNHSARWCSMSGCGNIVKMRRAHARASNAGD